MVEAKSAKTVSTPLSFDGMLLKAGPYRYKIIEDTGAILKRAKENGDDENLGMCDHVRGEIYLDPEQYDRSLKETAHHEWLHMAFYQSGLSYLLSLEEEERIISLLSPALLANMQENFDFVTKLVNDF